MKKQAKKLVLAKETLRGLVAADLTKIAGGTTYGSCGRNFCEWQPDGPPIPTI